MRLSSALAYAGIAVLRVPVQFDFSAAVHVGGTHPSDGD